MSTKLQATFYTRIAYILVEYDQPRTDIDPSERSGRLCGIHHQPEDTSQTFGS